jgi:hypothetical protein
MKRVFVPVHLARVGDVLEWGQPSAPRHPDWFSVVTRVGKDEEGNVHIQSLRASGKPSHDICPSGTVPGMFSRIGEGCTPTLEGLWVFLRENGLDDFGPTRYPVSKEERERFNGKTITLQRVLIDHGENAGMVVSGEGMLFVHTNDEEEGSAEIHVDEPASQHAGALRHFAVGERMFRRIEETPDGLLLRGED